MPKQPTAEDLGGTPGVAGARPVGTYDVDPYARGAQKIANAGEHFGASIARLGESEAEFAARRGRAEFNEARTRAITGLIGLRSQYAADRDYTTVKQRWTDDTATTVDNAAGVISSEPVRQAARLAAEQAMARAGRTSTVLTAPNQGQAAGGTSVPYTGTTLGGGR